MRRSLYHMPGALAVATLSALALAVGLTGSAWASSLVYIHENNVWLAAPDGSGQYQVTLDGTAGEPYESPSQAENGTIEAERHGKLYRMTQNGTLLNAPFATSALRMGLEDPLISPDGSKVSFWSWEDVNPCGSYISCSEEDFSYQVSYSDHWVDPSTFVPKWDGWVSYGNPSWLGNSRELLFIRAGTVYYYELGQPEPVDWFQWSEKIGLKSGPPPFYPTGKWYEGAASADGTRLALLAFNETTQPHRYEIQIFSASGDLQSGNPPELPHAAGCSIEPPDGSAGSTPGKAGSFFDSLSWSPDGSSLAYEYNGAIYVAQVTSLTNCNEDPITQVIPAGSDPNWGPANVSPAPRPPKVNPALHPAPPAPPIVKLLTPTSPCAGKSGVALQECNAKQHYEKALAACEHRYSGKRNHAATRHGKRKYAAMRHAGCHRRAKAAYQRRIALIRCQRLKSKHARAQCLKKARRSR